MLVLEDERDEIGEEARSLAAGISDRGKVSLVSEGYLLRDTFR